MAQEVESLPHLTGLQLRFPTLLITTLVIAPDQKNLTDQKNQIVVKDLGCTATFSATQFLLHHRRKAPILIGERHERNLWRIQLPNSSTTAHKLPTYETNQVLLLHHTAPADAEHIRFVHACLGSPPPTTILRAVARG